MLINTKDPDEMSAEERMQEIAAILAHANNIPWKIIEHDFKSSKSTLWRHMSIGTGRLSGILNNNDPDGTYQEDLQRF